MQTFRGLAIACLIMLALTSRANAQIAGTLDLQTHCEKAIAGIRITGDMFQLPVAGGDAYQCSWFHRCYPATLASGFARRKPLYDHPLPSSEQYFDSARPCGGRLGQKHPEKLSEP